MKQLLYRAISLGLILFVLTGTMCVAASDVKYIDIAGHWAENTMEQALKDALIAGNGTKLNPDSSITVAEAVTILCRVFSNTKMANLSGVSDVEKGDWFYESAAKAVAMGIISPEDGRLGMNSNLTRVKAFEILAEAFQLTAAEPDMSVLSRYSDGDQLAGKDRRSFASLVSAGLIKGYGGSLHLYDTVSRAEFLTVLYRIVSGFMDASAVDGANSGGVVLKGDGAVSDRNFSDSVYFDCTSSNICLKNVTASDVVLRSDTLAAFSAASSTIDRLVIAARAGDVAVAPQDASQIGKAVIGTGGGTVTLGGNITKAEITGDGRNVVICDPLDSVWISGSNNTITIGEGTSIKSIRILASGSGNLVTINGTVKELEVAGSDSSVDGAGVAENVILNAADSKITVKIGNVIVNDNYGLYGISLDLKAPKTLPAGQALNATARIKAPADGKTCRGTWYLNDVFVSSSKMTLKKESSAEFSYHFKYSRSLPKTAKLTFVLSYADETGVYQEIRSDHSITLENYSEDYYKQQEFDQVLAKIKTGYQGDYTLSWAQANDYAGSEKEMWVNAKGYSSKTDYMIWVSIAYQRVNVFSGAAGNWKLIKTFLVGTGAPGNDTPTGTWHILGKLKSGWSNDIYTVKPVMTFKDPSYGFHSRIYYPGTTKVQDSRIGFPCSHGCIRMYTEDIAWMYDTIPVNTTVVVY